MNATSSGGAGAINEPDRPAPQVAGLDVHWVPRTSLKPAPYNPRKMSEREANDLRTSLREFGFVEPLVVNSAPGRENIVIGGHQRLRIAEEFRVELVPVVFLSLDEKRERELNLRLNKNVGSWDWNMLANFDVEELREVGFEDEDLNVRFGLGLGDPNDPNAEWAGMPEFDQRDKTAFRSVVVRFRDARAVEEFAALIGQPITDKARFLWFPVMEIERFADKAYSTREP